MPRPLQMLHTMTDETFELILKVHNTAPFRLIREAAPYFRVKDPAALATNRSIVNISSIAGLHGNVGQTNYATAKAGVVGLTYVPLVEVCVGRWLISPRRAVRP